VLIAEAQKEKERALPVSVNFVLDEFCNIPKIPDMPSMISAARSRNMRFYLVAQSIHQLRSRYGEDADTIKGNCDNWVFLTSKELALLNEISELCGSVYASDHRYRRLISISELQRLDKEKGEALIMHARQYPIITEIADIDQYPMFRGIAPVRMEPFRAPAIGVFSPKRLEMDIRLGKRKAPFPKPEQEDDEPTPEPTPTIKTMGLSFDDWFNDENV
jgi:type IV secretion system protein VirD4